MPNTLPLLTAVPIVVVALCGLVWQINKDGLEGLRHNRLMLVLIGCAGSLWAGLLIFAVGWQSAMDAGTATILGLAVMWRSPRIPAHCCQKCGYNLTGNVSGTCPECGTPAGPPGPTG